MQKTPEPNLRPLALIPSLLYFGLPALLMTAGFHLLMPALIRAGLTPLAAYGWSVGPVFALMIAAAILLARREGFLTRAALVERFRIRRLTRRDWGTLTIGLLVMFAGYLLLSEVERSQIAAGAWLPFPASLPAWLNPVSTVSPPQALDQAFGGILDNWAGLVCFSVILLLSVVGEELWWRGYIFPRQEIAFGRHTWWIHGLLWAGFYLYKWWDVPALLPVTLSLSYTVFRLKNNLPGFIQHLLFSGISLLPVLIGIIGLS